MPYASDYGFSIAGQLPTVDTAALDAAWLADRAEAAESARQWGWDDLASRAASHRRYAIPARQHARGL